MNFLKATKKAFSKETIALRLKAIENASVDVGTILDAMVAEKTGQLMKMAIKELFSEGKK